MKNLIVVIALAAGGYFGFQHLTAEKLTPEERMVQDIEEAFDDAVRDVRQAGRGAGLSGIDTTGDVVAAQREIKRLSGELKDLVRRLETESAQTMATQLESKIKSFQRSNR